MRFKRHILWRENLISSLFRGWDWWLQKFHYFDSYFIFWSVELEFYLILQTPFSCLFLVNWKKSHFYLCNFWLMWKFLYWIYFSLASLVIKWVNDVPRWNMYLHVFFLLRACIKLKGHRLTNDKYCISCLSFFHISVLILAIYRISQTYKIIKLEWKCQKTRYFSK